MKIEVICWVPGPLAGTKVEPDLSLFTYWSINKDSNLVFDESEHPNNHIIGYPFTSLVSLLTVGLPYKLFSGLEKGNYNELVGLINTYDLSLKNG